VKDSDPGKHCLGMETDTADKGDPRINCTTGVGTELKRRSENYANRRPAGLGEEE
jgi:hypothetical protein